MERRRQRIALIEGLRNTTTGLGQARVIDRYAHQPSRTVSQGALEDGPKQLLRLPLTAGVQEILCTPTAILAAVGPDEARQATPPQADQRTQGLAHRTLKGALLRKHTPPVLGNSEELGQETH